ncbi:MAG: helix-turn-helix domain-containing protein [Rhodospirillales bacterium]|nr:helix-turn-helix domain-containing protein [Rhodospirillales bacterium]
MRGLTVAELAHRAGLENSTVHKVVSGKRKVSDRLADPLAKALQVPREMLYARTGRPISPTGVPTEPESAAESPSSGRQPSSASTLSRDVPVFGTAQAGPEGAFHLNTGEPIDWARRPAGLIGVKGVFAIYVEGDSMVPWRQPGERVFVHEKRPPAPGCHVIAEVWSPDPGHPPRAFLKRLLRRTATRVELEQYNPPKTIEVEAERVGRLYRVIEWEEVQGL